MTEDEFFDRPKFWFHVKQLFLWPVKYLAYRRRYKLFTDATDCWKMLATHERIDPVIVKFEVDPSDPYHVV